MSTIGEVLSGLAQWCVLEADCSEVMRVLPTRSVDHILSDPPFSEHVHSLQRRILTGPHRRDPREGGARGSRARDGAYHGNPVVAALGFGHLTAELRRACGVQFARVAKRWIIVKADEESRHLWQADLERGNARHVRCGTWWKVASQPQLSGDRPAVDREALEIAHARGERLRWNGGGKHASWMTHFPTYRHQIATDRNNMGDRVHTTQTPLALWLALVEDFTDPGDLILDPFCGSGSLGIACVRLGRRYLGMDNGADASGKPWAQWAREGIEAESKGLTRSAARAGQGSLFA